MRTAIGAVMAAAALLAGCGEPVPQARSAYVGVWQGQDLHLEITATGHVAYERRKAGGNVSIQAPLQGFEGDDFVVGFGPFSTTFKVSVPPHRDGVRWRMVVDGVPVERVGRSDEIRA